MSICNKAVQTVRYETTRINYTCFWIDSYTDSALDASIGSGYIFILLCVMNQPVAVTDCVCSAFLSVVLQRAAFAHFPELQDFALANVAAVDTRDSLKKHFGHLR